MRDRQDHARPRRGWAIVARYELAALWLGQAGLAALLIYSVLMSALTFIVAGNAALNLLDARETVSLVVQVAMGFGALAAVVLAADAISGERDRGSLEPLILTPIHGRDLALGKLLGAYSVWLGAVVIALPYIIVLARGPGLVLDAVLVLGLGGSLATFALATFAVLVSILSPSSRMSLVVAIAVLIALAIPNQLPQASLRGVVGELFVAANPVSSILRLADAILINQATWASQVSLLTSSLVAAAILVPAVLVVAPRIGLAGLR